MHTFFLIEGIGDFIISTSPETESFDYSLQKAIYERIMFYLSLAKRKIVESGLQKWPPLIIASKIHSMIGIDVSL